MTSERLKIISSLIDNSKKVADIGSDHGYLPLLLKEKGNNNNLLAVENKKGPFDRLNDNIKNSGYKGIITSLSDGLDDLTNDYDTVVLAGMGYDNIVKIINKNINKLEFITDIIVDSHTKRYELRKFITNLGYSIVNEACLNEKGIYYEIIHFVKKETKYIDLELKYGPLLMKRCNKTYLEHLKDILHADLVLAKKVDISKKKVIETEIEEIKKIIN